jgi:hypothetical protein
MKKLFYLFTLLTFFSLAFTSCKDDNDVPKPEPTGSIKATVSPAGSASNMRVTQGSTTFEITPDGAGVFQANNLTPGDFSVTFTPAMGFQAPAARNVTVTSGNTSDLGTVGLTQPGSQLLGTMSANVNGSSWISTIHGATVNGTNLTITGTSANVSGGTSGTADAIILTLQNVTGTGTFSGPINATAIYTQASLIGGTQNTWASAVPGGNCTVVITKLDQSNKKISGTFSFVANAAPGGTATGSKSVNSGSFTNLNIQ